MFRHQGESRTFKHNMQLAGILSLVAGIVNVAGFLYMAQLTTNVTGHFALFINDVANFRFWHGLIYLVFILCFLAGSFSSGFLMEWLKKQKKVNVFVVPMSLESLLLISVAIASVWKPQISSIILSNLLLFAMGLQNSFVTKISNAVVRTTHLTGLFTDLGIELSRLFFERDHSERDKLISTIELRAFIIATFFAGGLIGGFLYSEIELKLSVLVIAAAILILSLVYDDYRFRKTSKR